MPVKETPSTRIWILLVVRQQSLLARAESQSASCLALRCGRVAPFCVPELKSPLKSITLDGDGSDIVLRLEKSKSASIEALTLSAL